MMVLDVVSSGNRRVEVSQRSFVHVFYNDAEKRTNHQRVKVEMRHVKRNDTRDQYGDHVATSTYRDSSANRRRAR
jgi:hypothetical protein